MKKTTVQAPANIAFIKYWGTTSDNLPLNSSISMNLSACQTITQVSLNDKDEDEIFIQEDNGDTFKLEKKSIKDIKAYEQINTIKKLSNCKENFLVQSRNTFPSKAGIASSASGFCALTSALILATGLNDLFSDKKELSKLVRQSGSASAARSVYDGFVELKTGKTEDDSYSVQIATENHWGLCDIIAVVSSKSKKTPSSEGHNIAKTSPYLSTRILEMQKRIVLVKEAIKHKDIEKLGVATEQDAISMHVIMMTSIPPLFYFTPGTMEIIHGVIDIRSAGVPAFYTIDAGANVHMICEKQNTAKVLKYFEGNHFIEKMIVNYVAKGVAEI